MSDDVSQQDVSEDSSVNLKAEEKKSKKKSDKSKGYDALHVGDNITIYPDRPVEKYNQGPVKAYLAEKKPKKPDVDYVAFVCDKAVMPRIKEMKEFASFMNYNLITLLHYEVVFWEPSGEERLVVVYRDNLGVPILREDVPQAGQMKIDTIIKQILPPIINVFLDLRDKELFHGAIRPSNLWTKNIETYDHVILGECLSLPASYTQPVLFETVTRGMANPLARGDGTPEDDMYALGVTLALLLRHTDSTSELSDAEIIQKKIETGSYAAIVGKDRFTGSTLELLRGLLHDDPKERWNIDDIQAWLDGRRLSPKPPKKFKKGSRPIIFGEEKYYQPAVLASVLEKDPLEVRRIVHEGDLAQWVERSLDSKAMAAAIKDIKQLAEKSGSPNTYEDRLSCYVSMALDLSAPIRYRGMHFFPRGYGNLLAYSVVNEHDPSAHIEMLSQGIVSFWLREYGGRSEPEEVLLRYDGAQKFVTNTNMGFGFERCLYFLNSGLPCLSPKLKKSCALTPQQIILAFDKQCKKEANPERFLDRHIIAFLFAKAPKLIDLLIKDVDAVEEYKKLLAELRILARIQKNYKIGPLKDLARTLAKKCGPLYERYHDVELQKKIEKDVVRHAENGDLQEMQDAVDNYDVRMSDLKIFYQAIREYRLMVKEHKELSEKLADKKNFGKKTGRDIGAAIASVIAGLTTVVCLLIYIMG